MKKSVLRKSILAFIALFSLLFVYSSCDSWMSEDDGFYEEIESEVKRANATVVNVYVRYAATKMGKTDPDGYATFKVDIPATVSATTETDYGFKRWAAFPTSFIVPGDTQYTNFVYDDDDSYAANYGSHELSSEVVTFADPYASTTEVTINEERNDIYLVPIVAKRPTVALSMPSSGSSGIVRNMTVRINFTKAMNPESFKDASGVYDKITVTQGTQSITADGDIEIASDEITNRFAAPTFSTNGKMITLKFNPESISEGYSAQSYVTINISKDVTDMYGYSMAEDYKLQFQVGSSFDTLAPRISELTAGVGNNYNTFAGIYKDDKTAQNLGSFTRMTLDGAARANSNIDNELYSETILSQRIKDKINIRIIAEDIAGSGSGQDQTGVESDVSMIGIRATNLINMDGSAADSSSALPIKSLSYIAQTNTSDIKGSYRDVTGENKGYLFTYDLSTLPDGLIKVDVWGYDSIGNNGLMEGGSYSSEYGNGYASIIVVKDTTAPDAAANASKVISYSSSAPYRWYSAATLSSMSIYQEAAGAVVDVGHPKLRAKDSNLQWIFNVTDQTDWGAKLSISDERWKKVEEGYKITNASIPETEGPVAISFVLKDDLNNISSVVPLNSIMYDNTPANVTVPTWVKADGSLALNASLTALVNNSILRVPFTDNLSGVKRLELRVSKDGKEVEAPVAASVYNFTDKANVVPAESEALNLDTEDSANSNNVLVFNRTLNGGVVYVQNLTIGEEDGIYTVAVNLYDNALNKSETKSTTIARDTTPPKVVDDAITVNEIFESTSYEGVTRKWLKKEVYDDSRTPNKASITFTVNETGSGIRNIKFSGGTVSFTNESVIKVNGVELVRGDDTSKSDYKLDLAANTVTLYDSYSPKIFGEAAVVTIENVRFGVVNNVAANVAKITLTDFVENNSPEANSPEVFADTENPAIAIVTLVDRKNETLNKDKTKEDSYNANKAIYTDEQLFTLYVTPASNEKDRGTGIKVLRLRDAVFTPETVCKIAGNTVTVNCANDTAIFDKPVTDITQIEFTNVKFINNENETKQIDVTPEDLMGWSGESTLSNGIIFDNTPSVITGPLKWITETGALALNASKEVRIDNSILRVPFEDNLSGIKRLAMTVMQGDNILENLNALEEITVRYTEDPNGKPNTAIPLTLTASDIENVSTVKVLKLTDAFGNEVTLKSGVLFIKGIKIGDTDGIYEISVSLFDNALNKSDAKTINTAKDTTVPDVTDKKVSVTEIAESTSYEDKTKYWATASAYDENRVPNKVTLTFKVKESGSGIRTINLAGGTVVLTAQSQLIVNDVTLPEGAAPDVAEFLETTTPDYYRDVANNTLTLHNSYFPKIYNENPEVETTVTITNVELKSLNSATANVAQINVTDFVGNTSTVAKSVQIFADNTNPEVTAVTISDRDSSIFKTESQNYTNSLNVDLSVNFKDQTSVCASGVKKLILKNAIFNKNTNSEDEKSKITADFVLPKYDVVDGTIIIFEQPFDEVKTVTLENIQICQAPRQLGNVTVSVTAQDYIGWNSEPKASNPICYDNSAPDTGTLSWTAETGVPGYVGSNILSDQVLHVPFTETPAGVKQVQLTITPAYGTPFANGNLEVNYVSGETTTPLTGYSISGDKIILSSPLTTGELTFKNLQISESNTQGEYEIKVTLTDIAENTQTGGSVKSINIFNDTTAPVVEKIEIPGLKKSVELVKGGTAKGPDGYWLDQEYIGGDHNNNYSATKVPLYITINESNSGVNLITLGGTMKLQSGSTLWTVAEDGTETEIAASKYEVNTTSNTIAIKEFSDALKNAAGKSNFVILVKNVKATNFASDENSVSVKVRDVALNESASKTEITVKGKTQTLTKFRTDSWACGMPSVKIVDENVTPIAATSGYTNDKLVTVYTSYGKEDAGASGHNKFTFTGAKFTDASEIFIATSETDVDTALNYVGRALASDDNRKLASNEYVISEDKTTLELRNADATEYYVFRNYFALKITNMELDNATTDGTKTVKSSASDLSGWNSDNASETIILDTTKPEWRFEAGTFAANSEKVKGTFIYPHPDEADTAYGIKSPTAEENKDGEIVRYYYTASKISGLANYGVVVGIGGKDANLRGYDKKNGVPYYICNTTNVSPNEIDANYVVTHSSMPSKDCNGNTTGSNSGWKTAFNGWEIMLADHTYSIVIVDEAGNYSTAKTIKIVQDTTKPSVKIDGTNSLSNVFTLDIPENSKVFRNPSQVQNTYIGSNSANNLYDTGKHSSPNYYSTNYVIKGSEDDYKIVVKLNGRNANDIMLDGTKANTGTSAYKEKAPTMTDSGLAAYTVSHWYADWCASSTDTSNYYPAFPSEDSNVPDIPDVSTIIQYMNYKGMPSGAEPTGLTTKCNWHPYTKGEYIDNSDDAANIIKSSVDSYGNISISIPKTEKTPPMALLLKDNCGNMNYILIRPSSMETDQKKTISFTVDSMISTDTTYLGSTRHIGMNPFTSTKTKEEDSNVKANSAGLWAAKIDNKMSSEKYNWGNRTSPYQPGSETLADGQTVIGTQARDLKGRTTYYNENAYIALWNKAETCTFDEVSRKATDDNNGYTLRARIRAWDETGPAPKKADFEGVGGEGTDFSSWYYLRDVAVNTNNDYVLQYPHPNRTSKFRLYYYVEDAVGNYEINTIVNDNKADGSSTQMLYWMYDNEKPVVKTRSGKNPATVTGKDIGELVATNNGFRPYYKATDSSNGTGYIVETQNKITGLPDNTLLGNGILLGCIKGENTKYGSYFDLNITETSGIRAFAYTSTSTAPAIPTSGNYGTASMGDDGTWYAGKTTSNGGTGMLATREIGSTLTYPYYSATSGTSLYSNAGDVTYDYYDASYGNYVYSGVKVVATIPYGVIKGDSKDPKDVYLHVMDWVGNITTVKLGDGIKWVNDSAGPYQDGKDDTNIYKDNCNITSNGNDHDLKYTFAATKIPSDSLKVYMPDNNKYTDAGSGLLGWSLTPYDLTSVKKDETGSYIEITDDKLTKIKDGQDAGSVRVYVYDNVGNMLYDDVNKLNYITLNLVGDKTPVPFTLYVRGTNSSAAAKDSFVVDTMKYMDGTSANGNNELGATATQTQIKTAAEVQNISSTAYVKDKYVTFLPCFGAHNATSHADYYRTEISYWDSAANKWEALDSSSTTALNGWVHTAKHTDDKRYYTTNNYTLDSAKIYYQFAVYDNVGNVNYLYAKIMQDNTPPTATAGSIEKVNQISGNNYYSTNSKAKMRYSDAGSGLKSYTGVSSVAGYVTESPEIEVNLGTLNAVSGKLQFTAKDNLGNGGSINLTYNESSEWVKDTTAPVATALTAQTAHKYTHNWSTSDSNSTNFEITSLAAAAGDFDNVHGSIQVVPGSGNAAVVSVKNVTGFKFKPAAIDSDSNLYGWYVNNEQKTGAELGFISVSDVRFTSEGYTFNSVPSASETYYFYPVDKAGNAGDPIILTFVEAAVPVINSVTPDSTTIVEKDGKYYFNSSSKITVEVHNPTEAAVNISSVRLAYSKNGSFTGLVRSFTPGATIAAGGTESITVVLSDAVLKDISDSPLYVWANTGTVSSAYKQLAYTLTYDGAGPANISISSVTGKNGSGATGFAAGSGTAVSYGKNAASIEITPTSTDLLDVLYSTSSSGPWRDKVTFTPGSIGASPVIYAKDSLGNTSNQPITFTLDDTVSPVTLTFNNTTGIYNDSANNTLYYKADASSISITANAGTDTDIAYYYYNDVANKSLDGNFTIENPDGLYNFYAVDNLGNETEVPAGITITKDDSIEIPRATFKWYKGETEVTEASYVSASGNAYTYNSNKINKIIFTPYVTSDVSGIKGYASSADSANWADTVTVENPSDEVTIYAKDKVGNISEPLTYSFTADGTGVKLSTTGANISGSFGAMDSTPPANVTANGVSGTVSSTIQGKDDIVGNGYTTQFIPSGSTFTVTFDGEHADLAGYGFTIGNTSSAYTDAPASFTPVADPSGATLTVTLPDITQAHAYLFLWLKDKVGNLSCYNICNGNMNWWLTYTEPAGFTWTKNGNDITVTGLQNVPVSSISLEGSSIVSVKFGFDVPTNHKGTKSYTKDGNRLNGSYPTSIDLGDCFAGEDSIIITATDANTTKVTINVKKIDETIKTLENATPNSGSFNGIQKFAGAAVSSVKSLFAPKTKKIDLAPKAFDSEKAAPAPSSESLAVQTKTSATVVEKSAAQNKKKAPARTKALKSRVAEAESVVTQSVAVPENGTLMAAAPIVINTEALNSDTNIEESSSIITVVEKDEAPKHTVPLYLVIFTIAAGIFIAGVIISSKKIIDKYN